MIVREGEEGRVSDSDAIKGVEPFKTWAEKYSIVQNTLKLPACACVCVEGRRWTRDYTKEREIQRGARRSSVRFFNMHVQRRVWEARGSDEQEH